MMFYLPYSKAEREVTAVAGESLDTVRAPLPLLPPIPLPEAPRLLPSTPLLDDWFGRLPENLWIAGASGFVTGWLKGSRKRSLRWTAENSHRKPDTKAGWYTYRKQKNYAVTTAGTLTGLRTAGRYCALTSSFILLEAAAEHVLLLNERWRHLRRKTDGAGAWWGADFWAAADDDDDDGGLAAGGARVTATLFPERRNDLRMAAGGALAGGLMVSVGGLYNRWFPPVIRRFTLFALAGGGTHGYLFSYGSHEAARQRAAKEALLGVREGNLDGVGPQSVEQVRVDEDETMRTLAAWNLAAQDELLAAEGEMEVVLPGKEKRAQGWGGWVPAWGRARSEDDPRP